MIFKRTFFQNRLVVLQGAGQVVQHFLAFLEMAAPQQKIGTRFINYSKSLKPTLQG